MAKIKDAPYIAQYLKLIEQGKIPISNEMTLAVARVKRYFKQYHYKHDEVEKRISFIENETCNTKGNNSKLKLALVQKFWLSVAWGFYHDVEILKTNPDTLEQYSAIEERRLVNEIPLIMSRGSGKTTLASAIAMVGLIADGEWGADVSCLATTREQSSLLFNASRSMTSNEDTLLYLMKQAGMLRSTKQGLLYEETNSLMTIKTSDYEVLDGLNSNMVLFDEIHSYDDDFIQVVKDGSSRKRENWQVWYISTNGTKRGKVFDTYMDEWMDILTGKINNDSVFPFIYKLDDVKEISEPDKWLKAIPMLGISTSNEAIVKDIEMSKNNPAKQAELMAKTFNLPVNNYQSFFTNEECLGNRVKFDRMLFTGTDERNAYCVLGVDISDKNDICSVSFMIPDGDKRYFFNKKYIPRVTLSKLPREQREQYEKWEKDGELHIHELDYNDQDYIFDDLKDFMGENKIYPIAVGYDRWNAQRLTNLFNDWYGDICFDIPQTVKILSSPLKIYKAKLQGGKIIFDDGASTWMHSNVQVKLDSNNNIFPNKKEAKNKIDTFASQLDAFVCYENNKEDLSYYFND